MKAIDISEDFKVEKLPETPKLPLGNPKNRGKRRKKDKSEVIDK